jgi:DNA-binding MarR family transcriptional regulator/GNAT superfamily N-acetyltransferase
VRHDPRIAEIRAFHRTVTERIGALQEHYLASGRSLGLDRLIWEIGSEGAEVRELRERLGLDSGYLSRQLRLLEADGLVVTEVSSADSRVRRASLTLRGAAELGVLDERSDELVAAILDPLSEKQRAALAEAATVVRRLFTASAVEIAPADPDSPEACTAINSYFAELAQRFERGFDVGTTRQAAGPEMTPPAGRFLLATLQGKPVGCVGLTLHGDDPAEVKRLWTADRVRGMGLGRRLLAEIETAAVKAGARAVRLETNRALTEAIGLYRSAGYAEIPAFNDEPCAHHWFEKELA